MSEFVSCFFCLCGWLRVRLRVVLASLFYSLFVFVCLNLLLRLFYFVMCFCLCVLLPLHWNYGTPKARPVHKRKWERDVTNKQTHKQTR
jgi:hypothetical protein